MKYKTAKRPMKRLGIKYFMASLVLLVVDFK